ncbi:malonate transporter subunit MadL [Runella limosa]|uniref:malonate transporter subunit MadL n=1 Tax=Runella limosa TaxID=370978 RepID=UPI0003FDC47B|nr:malonate transporter subunit MadL [Runella limosa]
MVIYGVALLAFCYLVGQIFGEYLGSWLGVEANVGGVGFAMLLLIVVNSWLEKQGKLDSLTQSGIQFWNQMYIPIIVAMASTQNVKLAVSSGAVAVLAGALPVLLCYFTIPYLTKAFKPSTEQ